MITQHNVRLECVDDRAPNAQPGDKEVQGSLRLTYDVRVSGRSIHQPNIDMLKEAQEIILQQFQNAIYGDIVKDLLNLSRSISSMVGNGHNFLIAASQYDHVREELNNLIKKLQWEE